MTRLTPVGWDGGPGRLILEIAHHHAAHTFDALADAIVGAGVPLNPNEVAAVHLHDRRCGNRARAVRQRHGCRTEERQRATPETSRGGLAINVIEC